MFYNLQPEERIFPFTKSYLDHELRRGAKEAGLKRIKVHALRHPYVKPTTKKILTVGNPKLSALG